MADSFIQNILRQLPGVDSLLEAAHGDPRFKNIPPGLLKNIIRETLNRKRRDILDGEKEPVQTENILETVLSNAEQEAAPRLVPLINATGVVLHTNLGRALLTEAALENLTTIAASYSNLEFNLEEGNRGLRYTVVEDLLCELTGAEAAMAVNNNAGAVLLCLDTLASGREVIVSRGELVEIGGSFRIPDVMAKSGGILKEVGTTNRTHLKDYQDAVTPETGLLLKVHTSNYRIQGFTSSVPLKEMTALGREKGIPVMEDLGSGSLIDFSRFGLPFEPTIQEAMASKADVVTFSGDKLLGGPQAGIITGKASVIQKIRKNPLTRALRIDKLTLAALESTLRLYRDPPLALKQIPTLRMLTMDFDETALLARDLMENLKERLGDSARVDLADLSSRTGGGAFPEIALPSRCVRVEPLSISAARLEKRMRNHTPAIIGRIENNCFIMDTRTLQKKDFSTVTDALVSILTGDTP